MAAIIVSAVADELVIAEGGHHAQWAQVGALLGGPALYLFGNALFKRVVFGFVPQSHIGGLVLLALLVFAAPHMTMFALGTATTAVMVAVAVLESIWRRQGARKAAPRGAAH